jgi:hypothetical protein
VENIGGKYLDQEFLDNPQRPVDELLRWHCDGLAPDEASGKA